MALIPPFFFDCVVAIGAKNTTGATQWVGTGFLFGKLIEPVQDPANKQYAAYLVTNKHVLQNHKAIVLRFNPESGLAAREFNESLVDASGNQTWTGHPLNNVDVAVISLNGPKLREEALRFALFTSDETSFTKQAMKDNEIMEGDSVFMLGFPMGHVGNEGQYVLLRSGVISRVREMLENRGHDFVVDAWSFPGNSGGPVVLKPEALSINGTKAHTNAVLIGVVKGNINYQETAVSPQTGRPRITFEQNTGLSLVEPVDHILDTIAADESRKRKTLEPVVPAKDPQVQA